MIKLTSLFVSLALLCGAFVACSDSDDDDGNAGASGDIAVTGIIVTGHKSNTIAEGGTEQLKATVLPLDANTDTTYTWKTKNAAIVSVDATGMVTAKEENAATVEIWAETASGIKSNILKYTVVSDVPDGETWITTGTTVSLGADQTVKTGAKVTLAVALNDALTEDVTYTWYSGDTVIAGATEKTYTLTAAEGDVTYKVEVKGAESNQTARGTVVIKGEAGNANLIEATISDPTAGDFFTYSGTIQNGTNNGASYIKLAKKQTIKFTPTKTGTLSIKFSGTGNGNTTVVTVKTGSTTVNTTDGKESVSVTGKTAETYTYNLASAGTEYTIQIGDSQPIWLYELTVAYN